MSLVQNNNLKTSYYKMEDGWKAYKPINNRKPKSWRITSKDYTKIVNLCFKRIAHYWANAVGGIYVKGLGYFALFRKGKSKDLLSFRATNGYYYNLIHVPIRNVDSLGGFILRRPSKLISSKVYHNVNKGMRYSMHYHLLKEYVKKKKFV